MSYKKLSILVILVALVLSITSLWDDSFIVDEVPHVGAGYSYITKGDMRLNPEHPPLAKDIAGAALSFLAIDQTVFSTQYWVTDINGQWNFGRILIYNSSNDVNAITRTAKTTMLIFFVLSAILIYRWTRERYGDRAAFIATLLFSFSPTVLAHSRFVTTDMPALFGVLLGTYFFIKYLQKPSRRTFWLAVLAFGVAQLTKFSVVLLAPLFILMVIAWCIANSLSFRKSAVLATRSLVLMTTGIILVVWPVYALHTMNYPPEKQSADTEFHLGSYGNRLFADPVVWASDKPVIRPLAYYATGILMVNQRAIGGNNTFFLGEVRNYAWKHYFPVVYGIKEPIAFWGLVVIVLLALSLKVKNCPAPNFSADPAGSFPADRQSDRGRTSSGAGRHSEKRRVWYGVSFCFQSLRSWTKTNFVEFSMLLWLAIYWYLSIRANLNIGVRHLLPTYGFVFILLAGQLERITYYVLRIKRKIVLTTYCLLLTALLGWYIVDVVRVHPYYLTYFNQLAGGPAGGHRYAVDSNLDWGQDLKRLADWVEKRGINKIHLDYFGWADQGYYLKDKLVWINAGTYKDARDFLAQNPNGGHIAVSASFYTGSRGDPVNNYIWLDAYRPIATIGNSIFVWKIRP
ncbi:MAG: glycosyltransferase family 39 protein [Candidatus Yanofskybacteria bacterium]|nr:glycosyltransferase family 39 protein [Candidatus Yanofskybacteria bacterium]